MCYLTTILVSLVFIVSCSGVNNKLSKTTTLLNKEETKLADEWLKKNIPVCKFLFNQPNDITVSANKINDCLDTYRHSRQPYEKSWVKKTGEAFIDNYLGDKLSPFLPKLSILELTNILNTTLGSMYATNPKFIKTLLDAGVSTDHILLQRIIWWSSSNNGCSVVMQILQKNAHLYKQKKYLDKPMPIKIGGTIKTNKHEPVYRRDDLFSFTYNHAHSVLCPNVIEKLLDINPDLRDSVDNYQRTPLHQYMDNFPNLAIGKKLISKNNINLQDSYGRTPLFILLEHGSSPNERTIEMTKALLNAGAKVDLKSKKGVTTRSLIMKHRELKVLL